MPTDLHVEVTLLSQGASYVAPMRDAGVAPDAGSVAKPVRDAGAADAAIADASSVRDAASDAMAVAVDSGANSAPGSLADAGAKPSAVADASPAVDAAYDDDQTTAQNEDSGAGCRLSGNGQLSQAAWTVLASGLLLTRNARRRRRYAATDVAQD